MRAADRVATSTRAILFLLTVLALTALLPGSAAALLHIDFEQPYYVHPGVQVWDFCLVRDDGLYHIFYHGIPESSPTAWSSDDIWHSTSPDLRHWSDPASVLTVSDEGLETRAVWAPDVVFDQASGLWWMAYTAVDDLYNQRIGMAWSSDLVTWQKVSGGPVFQPDSASYFYYPQWGWAECRDPYLYREGGLWHMLVSAKVPGMAEGQGAVAHTTSLDMTSWSPSDVFLTNDGPNPVNTPESCQYVVRDGVHHLFLLESGLNGLCHIANEDPDSLTFDDCVIFDLGLAPEIESFDDGASWLIARTAPYQEPDHSTLSYVARIDTLIFRDGLEPPAVYRAPPLAEDFAVYSGNMCLGNPCFGDNPARRGEDPVGLVGQFFFGSREYFQGPLSGRGDAGSTLGDTAMGSMDTPPFTIEGDRISMLVSGTNAPETCFIALMDAQSDTVIMREHGLDDITMTLREWDVRALRGREVYVRIEDSDPFGHINVDEIIEAVDPMTTVHDPSDSAPDVLRDLGPSPNPFNPSTTLRFELAAAVECRIRVHDLRGRLVWDSGRIPGRAGVNTVTWNGCDVGGGRAPGGVYVYRLGAGGRTAASGKLTLVP